MSDTLALDVRAALSWLRRESHPLSTVADASRLEYLASLTPGSEAGQVDLLWYDEREIAAGEDDDLNLTTLSRALFGSPVEANFATVKALLIVNLAETPGDDLSVGGAGSVGHAWAEPLGGDPDAAVQVPAQSALLLTNKLAGWPVTASTADVLRLTNDGTGSVTVRIVIAGNSV